MKKGLSDRSKRNIMTFFGVLFVMLMLYYGTMQLVKRIGGSQFLSFFSGIFGKELLADDKHHTNILLLGIGGEGHDGGGLTDTIMVASLDQDNRSISFVSIPRDIYLKSTLGNDRINSLYEQGKLKWGEEQGVDFARTTIEKMLAIPIQYAVKVDFKAFEKVVDSVDGIDVYVEETINDPFYPKGETYQYETFYLKKGNQHLDGATALKYVRSRKTTSDFDRSRRQQQVIVALKNKTALKDIWGKKNLIEQLYYSLQQHVTTNMSIPEMLSLADFGAHWNSSNVRITNINDDPFLTGGFLYTPAQKDYNGAFVFLPAGGDFSSIRKFIQFVLYEPSINNFPIAIMNGTLATGIASKAGNAFKRFGGNVLTVANAPSKNVKETTWYVLTPAAEPAVNLLKQLVPGTTSYQISQEYKQKTNLANVKIILEIGSNSIETISKLDIFRNVVYLPHPSQNGTTTNGTTTNNK